jgi:hypothetical protein
MGAAGILAASLIPASALDLTAGGSGTINGATFTTSDNQSTGTGVIDSFVRLQDNGIADGYNSSLRPVMTDVNTSPQFTRDLKVGEVPEVTLGGVVYYEFLLDINQTKASPLLSLNELQIYTRGTGLSSADDLTDLTSGGASKLRYDLDGLADETVLLNYSLNNGSGSGDLFVYIAKSAFGNALDTDFLYLYSSFGNSGDPYSENDGFEEWAIRTTTPVNPPPSVPDAGASLALLGMGLIGVEALRRKLS